MLPASLLSLPISDSAPLAAFVMFGVLVNFCLLAAAVAPRAAPKPARAVPSPEPLPVHPEVKGIEPDVVARVSGIYLPPDGVEQETGKKPTPLNKILDKFLTSNSGSRCLLVLGEPGFGRTSLLINSFLRHRARGAPGNLPIFVVGLGHPNMAEQLREITDEQRSRGTLFLDDLETVSAITSDPTERWSKVLELGAGFKRVIVTARTDRFSNLEELPNVLFDRLLDPTEGEVETPNPQPVRVVTLLPLSDRHIGRYIRQKYPFWKVGRRRAMRRLVERVPKVGKCPLLLSCSDDLLASQQPILRTADALEAMVTAWLARESASHDPELLLAWARRLALLSYRSSAQYRGPWVSKGEAEAIGRELGLYVGDPVPGRRSLLTRTKSGDFCFINSTVMEYLFVQAFFGMSAAERQAWVGEGLLEWTRQVKELTIEQYARPGANLSYADLTGIDLRGVDLSECSLERATLSGLDLSGTRFVNANFKGVDLRDAVLVGAQMQAADFTGAMLANADLTQAGLADAKLDGADLRRAILERADLAGASLTGARLDFEALKSLAPSRLEWEGSTPKDPVTGIRFSWIPGGKFQMGHDGDPRESSPAHWVRLSSFWLGETPVTNRQYARFLEDTGRPKPEFSEDPRFVDPDQPAVGVTFDDAVAFCEWLGAASGLKVMLPSEAQWEYAARGTDGREYPWGSYPPDPSRACYAEDAMSGRPAKVGSFPPGKGPYGTLDQAGNVWEWCADTWDPMAYLKRANLALLDPVVRDGQPGVQLVRGGSWFFPEEDLNATVRGKNEASTSADDLGFRVALSCDPSDAPPDDTEIDVSVSTE